jgi:hypothetical protein
VQVGPVTMNPFRFGDNDEIPVHTLNTGMSGRRGPDIPVQDITSQPSIRSASTELDPDPTPENPRLLIGLDYGTTYTGESKALVSFLPPLCS